jgi:hypothetical protein
MGEKQPIRKSDLLSLKKILLKALTKNQILILNEISKSKTSTITSLLTKISVKKNIPLSTLKSSAKILKELQLINKNSPLHLTKLGEIVLQILGGDDDGR